MRRARAFVVLAAATCGALSACSFVNSLDYLTNGGPATEGGVLEGGDDASDAPALRAPSVVASGQTQPQSLVLDATNAYWASSATGEIFTAPKDGSSAPRSIGRAPAAETVALAVDAAGDVYWAGLTDGSVHRIPKAGGDVLLASGQASPSALAVDATTVYWTDGQSGQATSGNVMAVAKNGGTPVVLYDDMTAVPVALALDATNVYFADSTDSTVKQIPKTSVDGGTALKTWDGVSVTSFFEFAADDFAFYFIDTDSNGNSTVAELLRTAPANTPAQELATADVTALAIDDTFVYWSNDSGGTISRVAKAGGAVELLAKDQAHPLFVAADATGVYWCTIASGKADGAILRIPR